ncbi:MAG: hypothetical protein GY941_30740, partial [Planctomycetes bacterium]|nr:hypothetical protein [Planctomycetota bacterium]
QVLGGARDRKAYDYLLPMGLSGPIFTVDFGEILFPELVFNPSDQHYLEQKEARISALSDYFEKVRDLPKDNPYRKTITDLVLKIRKIGLDFVSRFIHAIPETFLMDHNGSDRDCYQTITMIDFLDNQFRLIAEQKEL